MKVLDKIFDNSGDKVDKQIFEEYLERSKRKKEDEKWLKENGNKIKNMMKEMKKENIKVGDIVASISIPNTSRFDPEKILEHYKGTRILNRITKKVVDESKLLLEIEKGKIDIDELKEVAWKESTGSPRLTVKGL